MSIFIRKQLSIFMLYRTLYPTSFTAYVIVLVFRGFLEFQHLFYSLNIPIVEHLFPTHHCSKHCNEYGHTSVVVGTKMTPTPKQPNL